MIELKINFIEIAITVFLTVFFQALLQHMFLTRRIMQDIQDRQRRELQQMQQQEGRERDK